MKRPAANFAWASATPRAIGGGPRLKTVPRCRIPPRAGPLFCLAARSPLLPRKLPAGPIGPPLTVRRAPRCLPATVDSPASYPTAAPAAAPLPVAFSRVNTQEPNA